MIYDLALCFEIYPVTIYIYIYYNLVGKEFKEFRTSEYFFQFLRKGLIDQHCTSDSAKKRRRGILIYYCTEELLFIYTELLYIPTS